jgi:hypothetical protein
MGNRQTCREALARDGSGGTTADVGRQIVGIGLIQAAPGDASGFFGGLNGIGGGLKGENQVVMEMIGFIAAGRDAVDVDSGEHRWRGIKDGPGFLHHLAAGGVPDFGVVLLDVSAGQEPSLETMMEDQQDRHSGRMQNESGRSDVARGELIPRERLRCMGQEHKDQLAALFVAGKGADQVGNGLRMNQLSIMYQIYQTNPRNASLVA